MSKQGRSHSKKKTLTLEEKMRVLDYAQDHPKLGCRKIADVFEVGETQVARALKDKQKIRAQYQAFASAGIKCSREAKYQEINEAVYKWYCLASDAMVPVNGPMIQKEQK